MVYLDKVLIARPGNLLSWPSDEVLLGPHGLSAFDLTQGYALASDVDGQLVLVTVMLGQAEIDVAKKLFENFKELHGIFSRMTAHEAQQKQMG